MKKLILITCLLFITSLMSQESMKLQQKMASTHTNVRVTVDVINAPQKQVNIFDQDLIKELSTQKPLMKMKANYNGGESILCLILNFKNLDDFYTWYRSPEVKKLFKKLKEISARYEIGMEFTKVG